MGLVLSQYFLMRRPSESPHIINSSTGKNVIKDSKKKGQYSHILDSK